MTSQLESHPGFIEEIDASEMELKDVSFFQLFLQQFFCL